MTDTYGWKLEWAKDADGEIGKAEVPLPANCVWMDWTITSPLEAGFGQAKKGRK